MATRTTLYWVTGVAYRRSDLDVEDAPDGGYGCEASPSIGEGDASGRGPVAVIGRTSLPTLPVDGGWQRVWFSLVVEEIVDVVEVEVEKVVVVSADVNIAAVELSSGAAATGARRRTGTWRVRVMRVRGDPARHQDEHRGYGQELQFACVHLHVTSVMHYPTRDIIRRILEVEFQKSFSFQQETEDSRRKTPLAAVARRPRHQPPRT